MAGNSKKISDLNAIATMHDTDLVEVSNDNQDSTYTSVKATIGDVAEHVAKTTEFTNDLDTTDKTLVGAINEVAGDIPTVNDATLTIQKNSTTIDTFSANASSNVTVDISVPTTVAELTDASDYATVASLAAVATSGDYGDLLNPPTIPTVNNATLTIQKNGTAVQTFTANASSDVTANITVPTTVAELSDASDYATTASLAAVATSGAYSDLSGAPTLATVATSGSYNDLTNKPAINDATITFTQGGTTKGTITLNQAADATIALDAGGGGGSNSVELTYEEYQALTPEQQLDGTEYFITDINGDGQQFQPICYSETEREIGVWVDGKPLYEKSYQITNTNISTGWNILINNVSGIDTFVSGECNLTDSSYDYSWKASYHSNGNIAMYNFLGGAILSANGYVTIRYTKTTDQAGSGTWTPQGVPAHHYSTDEQVVGTWIDGNTLYEKTLTYNITTSLSDWTLLDDTVSYDTLVSAQGTIAFSQTEQQVISSSPTTDPRFEVKSDHKLYYFGSATRSGYVTIRYTKSST